MQTNVNDDWVNSTLWVQDASINEPAVLTIKIKVFLQQEGAQTMTYLDMNGHTQTQSTIDWDAASWEAWRRDLPRVVSRGWSNHLWLEPSRSWRTDDRGRRLESPAANSIRLRLSIDCRAPAGTEHVIIRSYRLPEPTTANPTPFWRSNMEAPFIEAHRRCSLRGDDTIGSMDNRDLIPKSSGQLAAVHEFGHYIGLSHVNAAAVPDAPNSTLAYGGTTWQRGDMMGHGTRIEPWHAFPWCQRLRRHLGGEQPRTDTWLRQNPVTYVTGTGGNEVLWYPRTGRVQPMVWFNQDLILDV